MPLPDHARVETENTSQCKARAVRSVGHELSRARRHGAPHAAQRHARHPHHPVPVGARASPRRARPSRGGRSGQRGAPRGPNTSCARAPRRCMPMQMPVSRASPAHGYIAYMPRPAPINGCLGGWRGVWLLLVGMFAPASPATKLWSQLTPLLCTTKNEKKNAVEIRLVQIRYGIKLGQMIDHIYIYIYSYHFLSVMLVLDFYLFFIFLSITQKTHTQTTICAHRMHVIVWGFDHVIIHIAVHC